MAKYLDLNGLETVWGKVTDKIAESKADWNQNDETADDYVKNRTHWEEITERTPIYTGNASFTLNADDGLYYASIAIEDYASLYNTLGQYSIVLPYPILYLIPDYGIYSVVWDNKEYVCEPKMTYMNSNMPPLTLIGNFTLPGGTGGKNEPFCISHTPNTLVQQMGLPVFQICCTTPPSNPLIAINRITGGNIYTIENRYLPNSGILNGDGAPGSMRTAGSTPESNYYALGMFAFAEGHATLAAGNAAHAEGIATAAFGTGSHAEGCTTSAAGEYSHVQGKYNIPDNNNIYAHIVGNGTSTTSSNAHTLDWDGNAWFRGSVYVGGTEQTSTAAIKILPAKLVSTETTPTTNDTICWLYE